MSKPFFVTGMPMTGTAWLSAFLTLERTICYHEPMGRISAIEQLNELFASDFYSYVGIADSGAGFFMQWIMENIKPRTVILDRDDEEIEAEMARMGFPRTNYLEVLRDSLEPYRNDPNVLWVPFEVVHQKRIAERIFWHCLPGTPFDEVRFGEFVRYKIEMDVVANARIAMQRGQIFNVLLEGIRPRFKLKDPPDEKAPTRH